MPDPVEQLGQTRFTVRSGAFHVQKPGEFARAQVVLVFESGDLLIGSHPSVALPVQADEDIALIQIGAIELARGVGSGPQLEHHRRKVQAFYGSASRPSFGCEFLKCGTDEDPQPLIRRANNMSAPHVLHSVAVERNSPVLNRPVSKDLV